MAKTRIFDRGTRRGTSETILKRKTAIIVFVDDASSYEILNACSGVRLRDFTTVHLPIEKDVGEIYVFGGSIPAYRKNELWDYGRGRKEKTVHYPGAPKRVFDTIEELNRQLQEAAALLGWGDVTPTLAQRVGKKKVARKPQIKPKTSTATKAQVSTTSGQKPKKGLSTRKFSGKSKQADHRSVRKTDTKNQQLMASTRAESAVETQELPVILIESVDGERKLSIDVQALLANTGLKATKTRKVGKLKRGVKQLLRDVERFEQELDISFPYFETLFPPLVERFQHLRSQVQAN